MEAIKQFSRGSKDSHNDRFLISQVNVVPAKQKDEKQHEYDM